MSEPTVKNLALLLRSMTEAWEDTSEERRPGSTYMDGWNNGYNGASLNHAKNITEMLDNLGLPKLNEEIV